jgi:hypothetical protein
MSVGLLAFLLTVRLLTIRRAVAPAAAFFTKVQMNEHNQRLQNAFLFHPADVRANRSGQLSPRQQARKRAGGKTMLLAMGIFVVVMLCTIGIVAFAAWQSGTFGGPDNRDMLISMAGIAVGVGMVILIGFLTSWRYMRTTLSKQISVAEGSAAFGKVRAEAAHFEIKIGATNLRLLTEEQQTAFQPGIEYRVFFLAGPAPTILSAEVIGTEAEAETYGREAETAPIEQDVVLLRQRRAVPLLFALAGLVLCIPIVGIAASSLPDDLRFLIMAGLCAVAIGFVPLALWFLGRR